MIIAYYTYGYIEVYIIDVPAAAARKTMRRWKRQNKSRGDAWPFGAIYWLGHARRYATRIRSIYTAPRGVGYRGFLRCERAGRLSLSRATNWAIGSRVDTAILLSGVSSLFFIWLAMKMFKSKTVTNFTLFSHPYWWITEYFPNSRRQIPNRFRLLTLWHT